MKKHPKQLRVPSDIQRQHLNLILSQLLDDNWLIENLLAQGSTAAIVGSPKGRMNLTLDMIPVLADIRSQANFTH